jgi:hypothetical protein
LTLAAALTTGNVDEEILEMNGGHWAGIGGGLESDNGDD